MIPISKNMATWIRISLESYYKGCGYDDKWARKAAKAQVERLDICKPEDSHE